MIYFDNSATTKIHEEVVPSMVKTMTDYFGNPSSLHGLGVQAQKLLTQARQQIATLFDVQADEVIFTSGGTESNNFAIKGTALEKQVYGNHIITSQVEHPSVRNTMVALEKQGFKVTYLPVDETGRISSADLQQAIRQETILVSIMAINNEVGSIQPIEEVGDILEAYPSIHFHVDGVQSLGHFERILIHPRVDLMSFSAHKFNGPRGMGVLYKKKKRKLTPLLEGGGQERQLRASTENLAGIVATAKAMRLTMDSAKKDNENYQALQATLRDYLSENPDFRIFSAPNNAPHILCFALKGVRGEVMVHALEEHDIYLSTTSACSSRATNVASSTLKAMAVDSKWAKNAVRVSFGKDNTLAEMKHFIQVLDQLVAKFERIQ